MYSPKALFGACESMLISRSPLYTAMRSYEVSCPRTALQGPLWPLGPVSPCTGRCSSRDSYDRVRVWHITFAFDPDVGDEPVGPVYECPLNHTVVLHFPSNRSVTGLEGIVGNFREEKPLTLTYVSIKVMEFGGIISLTGRRVIRKGHHPPNSSQSSSSSGRHEYSFPALSRSRSDASSCLIQSITWNAQRWPRRNSMGRSAPS